MARPFGPGDAVWFGLANGGPYGMAENRMAVGVVRQRAAERPPTPPSDSEPRRLRLQFLEMGPQFRLGLPSLYR